MALHDKPSHGFATSPFVTIQLKPSHKEYKVHKDLVCIQSPYFKQMLESGFQEGIEQQIPMDEAESFITAQSVEMLIQWLYCGRVVFEEMGPVRKIGSIIDFLRLADMCQVFGMEKSMSEQIKAILIAGASSWNEFGEYSNTNYLTSEHVHSAIKLPKGHILRGLFADASVKAFLEPENHQFSQEAEETEYGLDLLSAVHRAMGSINTTKVDYQPLSYILDPLTGEKVYLKQQRSI